MYFTPEDTFFAQRQRAESSTMTIGTARWTYVVECKCPCTTGGVKLIASGVDENEPLPVALPKDAGQGVDWRRVAKII